MNEKHEKLEFVLVIITRGNLFEPCHCMGDDLFAELPHKCSTLPIKAIVSSEAVCV